MASDGCNVIGKTFVDYTATYMPGDLSSIRDGTTYSFNFADLPCPPESVSWTQPGPYAPTLAAPPFLTDLDPAWESCIAGASQGIDPFTAHEPASKDSGVNDGGHFRKDKRIDIFSAHRPASKDSGVHDGGNFRKDKRIVHQYPKDVVATTTAY